MPFRLERTLSGNQGRHDVVAVWDDDDGNQWLVALDLKVVGGVHGCSAITVTAQTPGCLLSQSALRQIPLAEIERAAFKTEVIEPTPQASGRGPQSGMALTDDDLQAVADAYITARNQRIPVQAFVADRFGVAVSTAAKRIAAARRHGFITPDTPPK
jgi:hypothetical protein